MQTANSIHEIYDIVGQIIIDRWIFILKTFPKYPISYSPSALIKSFDYETTFRPADEKTGRFQKLGLKLSYNDYAEYLDRGRRPGAKKVPIQALIKFIKIRNLQSKIKGRKGRFTNINQIAFMIQNSIYRKGIKGRKFLISGLEEGDEIIRFYLDRDLLDILLIDITKFYDS